MKQRVVITDLAEFTECCFVGRRHFGSTTQGKRL